MKKNIPAIIAAAVNAVVLLAAGIMYIVILKTDSSFSADSAKQAWDGGEYTYGQVTLCLNKQNGLDLTGAYSLNMAVKEQLKANSVALPEGSSGRLWIDCGYGESELSAKGTKSTCDVVAGGTFNDFFIFHPFTLISGSFYTPDTVNVDTIVIDKQASWQLFGAMDTAGLTVEIDGRDYRVSAVVDCPDYDDGVLYDAYGSKPRVYMPYEALCNIDNSAKMTVYEICIPNVVDGFAAGIMDEINPADENSSAVIDQTGRFEPITLFKGFREISQSAIIDSELCYPWYENTIRAAEIRGKIIAGLGGYMLIIPLVSAVYGIFRLTKLAAAGAGRIKQAAENAYQKKISAAYYKKHPEKKPYG